jgi:hypothetical protein
MTMPEVDNLEDIWLQEVIPCILQPDCENEARWKLVVVCPCRTSSFPSCDSCKNWLQDFLESRGWTDKMRCTICAEVCELTWRKL